jgi:hypothetical protein
MAPKDDPGCYLAASGLAAVVNFPLWKASAIAQAGFKLKGGQSFFSSYLDSMKPPYKGVGAVLLGMTWARAVIFWGSDSARQTMLSFGFDQASSTIFPPVVISTIVQIVNQPIVRASITIQDPSSPYRTTLEAARDIARTKGLAKLWHGTSAGIMKTVPKYCTAIAAKELFEEILPKSDGASHGELYARSAVKSVLAGVAGAALTNPFDVLRNEMFKTDLSAMNTVRKLIRDEGSGFLTRGIGKNMVAVAIPIAITIFGTDTLVSMKSSCALSSH